MIQQGQCFNVIVTNVREEVEGTSVGKNSGVPHCVTEDSGGGVVSFTDPQESINS